MRQLYIYISFITFSLFSQNAVLEVDTNKLRIGEQFNLKVKVYASHADSIIWPISDTLFSEFELLNKPILKQNLSPDTYLYKNFLLTSFDTGRFALPTIPLLINSTDTIFTNSVDVDFLSIPIDTTNQFFDIRGPKKIPFLAKELVLYIPFVLLFLLILLGTFLLFKYFKGRDGEIVGIQKPEIPIDIYFLNQLNNLEKKKYLESRKYKDFYTELSEIFRGYLELRFNIPALESSTYDLKILLNDLNIKEEWLNDFLRNCDIVKFAKGVPSDEASIVFLKKMRYFIKHYAIQAAEDFEQEESNKTPNINKLKKYIK